MCVEESMHIVFDKESAMTNHKLQDDEELSRTSIEFAQKQVNETGTSIASVPL